LTKNDGRNVAIRCGSSIYRDVWYWARVMLPWTTRQSIL
jgi:hypothetical protein